MKSLLFCIILTPLFVFSQNNMVMNYEPGPSQPYGALNPNAPKELSDFAPLIGTCDCESVSRKVDQTWAAPQKMTWTFRV